MLASTPTDASLATKPTDLNARYSKWDNIEISDDSDFECHPNVDKPSMIRAKQSAIRKDRAERSTKKQMLEAEQGYTKQVVASMRSFLDEVMQQPGKLEHFIQEAKTTYDDAAEEAKQQSQDGAEEAAQGKTIRPEDFVSAFLVRIARNPSHSLEEHLGNDVPLPLAVTTRFLVEIDKREKRLKAIEAELHDIKIKSRALNCENMYKEGYDKQVRMLCMLTEDDIPVGISND
jgi:cell division cycle protein 37